MIPLVSVLGASFHRSISTGNNIANPCIEFQPSSEQVFSEKLVESKRRGRSLTAVILGMNVTQALKNGMIDESLPVSETPEQDDSLFVSDNEEGNVTPPTITPSPFGSTPFGSRTPNAAPNPFGALKQQVETPQANNIFGSQSSSRLSAAAPSFTPQSSIGSTAVRLHHGPGRGYGC